MATYRNSNDEEVIYIPSEFKLLVHMDPIDGCHLGSTNFTCTFWTGSKKVEKTKAEMIPDNPENPSQCDDYVVLLNSQELGKGTVNVMLHTTLPDDDFIEGRKEAVLINTKLKIK